MSNTREQADQAADRVRDELLTTLEELDRRRLKATDWRFQMDQHRPQLLIAAAGAASLVVAVVGLIIARRRVARRRRVRRRWDAVQRAWEHPERIASRAGDAPGLQQLARKVLVAFGVALAARAGKRAAAAMVPTTPKRPPGEPYMH
ncbi:MAG TPA: hypothetical protein VND93_22090 [Myxococcales bacterium]|nr:hypothetical protein [Myxococcales bacterium]